MTDRVDLLAGEIDGSADALAALLHDLSRHERAGQVRTATRKGIPAVKGAPPLSGSQP